MPLVVEAGFSWKRLWLSLAAASIAAGLFSIVVLVRDHALEQELASDRETLAATIQELEALRAAGGGGEGEGGGEVRDGESERERLARLREELEAQRGLVLSMEAELQEERGEKAKRDVALEEAGRERAYLRKELAEARANEVALAEIAAEAQEIGSMAGKVAGGVLLCTVLWDASAFLGNPFAVPGITDNLVCGGIATGLGIYAHNEEHSEGRRARHAAIEGPGVHSHSRSEGAERRGRKGGPLKWLGRVFGKHR